MGSDKDGRGLRRAATRPGAARRRAVELPGAAGAEDLAEGGLGRFSLGNGLGQGGRGGRRARRTAYAAAPKSANGKVDAAADPAAVAAVELLLFSRYVARKIIIEPARQVVHPFCGRRRGGVAGRPLRWRRWKSSGSFRKCWKNAAGSYSGLHRRKDADLMTNSSRNTAMKPVEKSIRGRTDAIPGVGRVRSRAQGRGTPMAHPKSWAKYSA